MRTPADLQPVEFLTPDDLAQELGISASSIRKHAAKLADAGRITPRTSRGWLFSPTDAEALRSLPRRVGKPRLPDDQASASALAQRERRKKKTRR